MDNYRVETSVPREVILDYIVGLPQQMLSSGELQRTLYAAIALKFYEIVRRNFLKKSRGETDEAGMKWKPLSPKTIASRPLTTGKQSRLGVRINNPGGRGLLTPDQNKLWKGIYYSNFKRLAVTMGFTEARSQAAKIAWGVVKARGGLTRLQVLGNRKVPILRVTDQLLESVSPGKYSLGNYTPRKKQIYKISDGSISLGSEVEYAEDVNKERPLWPDNVDEWLEEAVSFAVTEVASVIAKGISK